VGNVKLNPDDDELYQRLLPIYLEHHFKNPEIYRTFAELYDGGRGMTAGKAMERALGECRIIEVSWERMGDTALEYEEIMLSEEIVCTLTGKP